MTSPQSRAAGAFSRDTALLRGGRLRKTSRGLLTFAPFLATASAVALGALLSLAPTDSAQAQTCTERSMGAFTCSGAATSPITIAGEANEQLTVMDTAGFSITTTSGNALAVTSDAMTDGMSIDLDGTLSTSAASARSLSATHSGTGALSITLDGDITASGGTSTGVSVRNVSSGSDMTIMANGDITANDPNSIGIYTYHFGSGPLRITSTGTITAGRRGIQANKTSSAGDITIDVSGDIITAGATSDAIRTLYATTVILRDEVDITGSLSIPGSSTVTVTGAVDITGEVSADARGNVAGISLAMSDDATPTDDSLTVANFAKGGTLALNADFMADSAAADRLIITGMITGTDATMITLTATGELSDLPSNMPLTLIEAPAGTGAAGDFALTDTTLNDAFSRDSATGNWIITGTGEPTVTPPPPTGNGGNGGGGMPPVTTMPDSCTEQSTMGTFVCDGSITETTDLEAAANETLNVSDTDGFTINVAMGNAFTLTSDTASTGMTVDLDGSITAGTDGDAISAVHSGSGAVSITTGGVIMAAANGIEASTTTDSSAMPTTMSITANGAIMAGNESDEAGIDASHAGSGDLTITANADVSGTTGISAEVTGDSTADITITIGGEVDGMTTAIAMTGGGNHRLVINSGGSIADDDSVTSDIMASDTDRTATLALNAAAGETTGSFDLGDLDDFTGFTVFEKTGAGTWTLTGTQTAAEDDTDRSFTSASVMAGTLQLNGATLELDGDDAALAIASGATLGIMGDSASAIMGDVTNSGTLQVNADLTLGASATFTLTDSATLEFMSDGNMISGSTMTDMEATLRLAGATGGSFDLSDLSHFENFATLDKMGAGTWTLTGDQPTGNAFTDASVMAGTLHLNGATLRPGTLTIASGGTLNITGSTTIMGILNTSAGTATATLGVNLTDPDAFTSERLTVSESGSTGSVAIALNVTSTTDQELMAADLSGVTLVSGAGTGASALTFSAANEGNCTIIGNNGDCTFDIDSNGALTSLTVTLAASDILYENYAASLAELSRVSGMRARFGNRIWATEEGRGIWARAEASNSELEPNTPSETSAAYEIRDTRLRFGVDAPIRAVPGLILGGNVWLARADTDITAAGADDGKIETEGYALAATAHWQASTGFYVDGQAQFAAFTSDLSSAGETRVDGNDGRGITLAAEVGYPVPVREFTITPQAQLSWSDVKFDDFTASDNDARISLGDGETVDARIGVSVDRRWSERSGTLGHVWGAIDLRAPLDGETSAKVGDDSPPLISEREEPALGLGMGVSFLLRDNTSIAAELATTQGDEIEEYKGSLALRFTF